MKELFFLTINLKRIKTMICYWLNGALCLGHENKEEHIALATLFKSFQAGLNPDPFLDKGSRDDEDNCDNDED